MAAGIIPAYDAFAEEYKVTVPEASYLTSVQVCIVTILFFTTLPWLICLSPLYRSCFSVCLPCFGTPSPLYMVDTMSHCYRF